MTDTLNRHSFAPELIKKGKVVLDQRDDWSEHQPSTRRKTNSSKPTAGMSLPWEEAERLDVRYVENWSVALDLQILWKTCAAVIRGSGAY